MSTLDLARISLRRELSVAAVSSFFSLYPGGRNALISWTTTPALGFVRVVDVVFVSATSVDVVGFEEGHLKKNNSNHQCLAFNSSIES